jgi:hypothetical protein
MFTLCDMTQVMEQFRFVTLVLYVCLEHLTFYEAGSTVTLIFCDNVQCVVTLNDIKFCDFYVVLCCVMLLNCSDNFKPQHSITHTCTFQKPCI